MKRLILPALCALALHAGLFKLDFDWTRPAFSVTESRAVTISLVQIPPAPEPQKQIAPLAPPRAQSIAPLKRVPEPRPVPKIDHAPPPLPPSPENVQPPVPEPAQDPAQHVENASPEMSSPDVASPNPDSNSSQVQAPAKQDFGPDRAEVQASVPLYALNPPPAYPAVARRRNYQGTVMLEVLVDPRGRATQIRIAQSSGYTVLDKSAVESVRQWRFEPARRLGQPIEMWVRVPVRFALE